MGRTDGSDDDSDYSYDSHWEMVNQNRQPDATYELNWTYPGYPPWESTDEYTEDETETGEVTVLLLLTRSP